MPAEAGHEKDSAGRSRAATSPQGLGYKAALMRLIATTRELADVCKRLARHDYVAVDTEFMREQTYWPRLCLVQLAGPDGEALVDPLTPGISLDPLFALMADQNVVKVFHAARQDLEIIWNLARLIPHPLFDTQVAAMVCGFGEAVSYVNLVKQVTKRDLDKTSRFTDWSRRPLSQQQLAYALGDVTHLREIYLVLKSELAREKRESWLDEEMAGLTDPGVYEIQPEDAWRRLKLRVKSRKGLAVLIELAAWRERAAQEQDVPRNRILRDEALYDIASHAPIEPSQLSQLRTLSEGFARSARAKDIIETVKRGLARDPKTVPVLRAGLALPPDKAAVVDLLRVLLKSRAAQHRVAPRLIADGDDLELLAMEDAPDIAALKGWRYDLFGAQAQELVRGQLALKVERGAVVPMPTRTGAAHKTPTAS
jgi:ribonuclease D